MGVLMLEEDWGGVLIKEVKRAKEGEVGNYNRMPETVA